jgi:hypothetical protein
LILPEQLAAALEPLDSRDANLLSLSFARGVPDVALPRAYRSDPAASHYGRCVPVLTGHQARLPAAEP